MKKTFLVLIALIFFWSLSAFALDDLTPANSNLPATTNGDFCTIQPTQLAQLLAINSQLTSSLSELKENSVSKTDLNTTVSQIMEYYAFQTISRLMIIFSVFLVLIFAILALARLKRFF